MIFIPYPGTCEVEPISSESLIASDTKTFVEAAKVIQTNECGFDLKTGDIVYFRPHGFFETPEIDGKKHYVLKVHEEFILGKSSDE